MSTELVCFRCVKVLGTKDPEHVKEVFECAGCGSAGYGALRVPKLDDLQRRRCKNFLNKTFEEVLAACNDDTPRSPAWGGSPSEGDPRE